MNQQQLYRPPDLLKDSEADVARWLAAQESAEAVEKINLVLERKPTHWYDNLAIIPIGICFIWFLLAHLRVMSVITGFALVLFFITLPRDNTTRRQWLRQQLIQNLERGGRAISLNHWIVAVTTLGADQRKAYDVFAQRLATATSDELKALTQDERAALRELLKEWPGEALQIALLLALGTAGDIFAKPYARRLVTNPTESEAVREAAEECLRSLERAS